MEYTEEEMKTIEQAKSNLLRGNDIESATLILEKVILDGMIIKCGRINILKVAARQIINFIEEYKNKEYLDVVREKVYANEESRRKDELIEKQQKEIEELKGITQSYNSFVAQVSIPKNQIVVVGDKRYFDCGYFIERYIPKDIIRKKIKELENIEIDYDNLVLQGDKILFAIRILEELIGIEPRKEFWKEDNNDR